MGVTPHRSAGGIDQRGLTLPPDRGDRGEGAPQPSPLFSAPRTMRLFEVAVVVEEADVVDKIDDEVAVVEVD